jgi:hypothetical protein
MLFRIRLVAGSLVLLWVFLFVVIYGSRLIASTARFGAMPPSEARAVSRKLDAVPEAKAGARKRRPAGAPADGARWEP